MWAVYGGHEGFVNTLLDTGADIEAQSKRGYTALILGASGGNKTIVELLLR